MRASKVQFLSSPPIPYPQTPHALGWHNRPVKDRYACKMYHKALVGYPTAARSSFRRAMCSDFIMARRQRQSSRRSLIGGTTSRRVQISCVVFPPFIATAFQLELSQPYTKIVSPFHGTSASIPPLKTHRYLAPPPPSPHPLPSPSISLPEGSQLSTTSRAYQARQSVLGCSTLV